MPAKQFPPLSPFEDCINQRRKFRNETHISNGKRSRTLALLIQPLTSGKAPSSGNKTISVYTFTAFIYGVAQSAYKMSPGPLKKIQSFLLSCDILSQVFLLGDVTTLPDLSLANLFVSVVAAGNEILGLFFLFYKGVKLSQGVNEDGFQRIEVDFSNNCCFSSIVFVTFV